MKFLENIVKKFNEKSLFWAANYPKAWSMGWLTQLCLAAILLPLTALFALILPVSRTAHPDIEMWFGLAFIPAFFWWIFIIYRLVKYNSDKLFGNRNRVHNFTELPTYLLQFLLPVLIPILLSLILNIRTANLLEKNEITTYKIAFEEAQPFFHYGYGQGYYSSIRRSHYHSLSINLYLSYFETDEEYFESISNKDDYTGLKTEREMELRRNLSDSIRGHEGVFERNRPKLYPTRFCYLTYDIAPKSELYRVNKYGNLFTNDSIKQLYYLEHYKDEVFVENKLNTFINKLVKYEKLNPEGYHFDLMFNFFINNMYSFPYNEEYYKPVTKIDGLAHNYLSNVHYIEKCKNWDHFFFTWKFMWIVLLMASVASVIFALFKNMSLREFLLGVFFLAIVFIISGATMASLRFDDELAIIVSWVILIVFFTIGLRAQKKPLRSTRNAFFHMIPHLFLPLIPLFILGTLDELFNFWRWPIFDRYVVDPTDYSYYHNYNSTYYLIKDWAYFYCTLFGFVFYFFVLYPLWIKNSWISFLAKPKKS